MTEKVKDYEIGNTLKRLRIAGVEVPDI